MLEWSFSANTSESSTQSTSESDTAYYSDACILRSELSGAGIWVGVPLPLKRLSWILLLLEWRFAIRKLCGGDAI